jgi:DNA-binding transcriptional MerR regulator
VGVFKEKGERFSEATLRKYVQLSLLPKSRRVGTRGKHRGSSGLYPVSVVRLINDIKRSLEAGATLEELRYSHVGLVGDVHALRCASEQVTERFLVAVSKQKSSRQDGLGKALEKQCKLLDKQIDDLEKFASRLRPSRDE